MNTHNVVSIDQLLSPVRICELNEHSRLPFLGTVELVFTCHSIERTTPATRGLGSDILTDYLCLWLSLAIHSEGNGFRLCCKRLHELGRLPPSSSTCHPFAWLPSVSLEQKPDPALSSFSRQRNPATGRSSRANGQQLEVVARFPFHLTGRTRPRLFSTPRPRNRSDEGNQAEPTGKQLESGASACMDRKGVP
jgi:hypothetical protein